MKVNNNTIFIIESELTVIYFRFGNYTT